MKKYKIKFTKRDALIFSLIFVTGTLLGLFFLKKLPLDIFSPSFYVRYVGIRPTDYFSWLLSFQIAHQTEVIFTIFSGTIHIFFVFLPLFLEFFELGYLASIWGASYIQFPRILLGFSSLILASKVGAQIYLSKKKWKEVIKTNKKIILLSILLMLINDIIQAFYNL